MSRHPSPCMCDFVSICTKAMQPSVVGKSVDNRMSNAGIDPVSESFGGPTYIGEKALFAMNIDPESSRRKINSFVNRRDQN